MARGSFDGEELDEVAPPSRRRWFVAASLVALLAVLFVGGALHTDRFNAYPDKGRCRESNVATAINVAEWDPPPSLPALPATAEAAIAAYAPTAEPIRGTTPGPFPADGWFEYRGRWIHEWSDDRFLQMWIEETEQGWRVDGYTIC